MAWDLFISYRHVDDRFPQGWVREFRTELEDALEAKAPDLRPAIWVDTRNLPGSEPIDEGLRGVLAQTRVFLCVVSPSYVDPGGRSWCAMEAEEYLRQNHVGGPRIVKVLKDWIDRGGEARLPEPVRRPRGYKLYVGNEGREATSLRRGQRDELMSRLAAEVAKLIEEARRPSKAKVFVLSASDQTDRAKLGVAHLLAKGFSVVPERLSSARQRRQQEIREALDQAKYAVLLFGKQVEDDLKVAYEHLAAKPKLASAAGCQLGMFVYDRNTSDVAQADLIAKLSDRPGFDSQEYGPNVWQDILASLEELVKAPGKPTVYLSSHPLHRMQVDSITKRILERDFDVIHEPDRGQRAHGVLVYSAVNEQYLERRFQEASKLLNKPVAIYPEPDLRLPQYALSDYEVISDDGWQPQTGARRVTFDEFLQKVKKQFEAAA
jgi:hypothetical protein